MEFHKAIYHDLKKESLKKEDKTKNSLNKTKDIDEYTIREKTAKILSLNFDDPDLNQIRNKLKNDKNYYVRRF